MTGQWPASTLTWLRSQLFWDGKNCWTVISRHDFHVPKMKSVQTYRYICDMYKKIYISNLHTYIIYYTYRITTPKSIGLSLDHRFTIWAMNRRPGVVVRVAQVFRPPHHLSLHPASWERWENIWENEWICVSVRNFMDVFSSNMLICSLRFSAIWSISWPHLRTISWITGRFKISASRSELPDQASTLSTLSILNINITSMASMALKWTLFLSINSSPMKQAARWFHPSGFIP